jgi:hypothetical protein
MIRARVGRAATLLSLLTVCPAVAAQVRPTPEFTAPSLPAAGSTVESLVPAGWSIEQRHQADFNNDGRADVLLLLRQAETHDTAPRRIVLVALATRKPRGFALFAANAELIPSDPSGRFEDPLADGEIAVQPRGFDVRLSMMSGIGSYVMATMRYRFRLERGCFRLIGYDRYETHRATLDTHDLSVNFLTGEVTSTNGNAQSNGAQIQRSRLASNRRRCLSDVPNGWTFDPLATGPHP